MGRLSTNKIKALTEPGRYHDADGLILNVTKRLSKNWLQRLTINHRRRDLGLGPWPEVSVQEARERAFENKRAVVHGKNPLADKERKVPTFREAALRFYKENLPRWKPGKNTQRWMDVIEKYSFPAFGDVAVNQVGREDVLRILTPIWTVKAEQARKLRQRVSLVLQWALAHGYVQTNIAGEQINGALPSMTGTRQHHRCLHYGEVSAAMDTIEQSSAGLSAKLCLRFVILTAVRSGEARSADWSDINIQERTWTIPAGKMKAKIEHRVPLSDEAMRIIEQARMFHDESGLLFPSPTQKGKPLNDMALFRVLRLAGLGDKTTTHGFRSAFRDFASERTSADHATMEICLAHAVGSSVERSYARSDLIVKRKILMQAWSNYLTAKQADVVSLYG